MPGLVRTVQTPEFAGVTFHEVLARSALNRVPAASAMPFGWTVNPYRGCTHACVYCFARSTHTYLDLDAGADFDTQIVVKVNVAEVLARELRAAAWAREPVALGTNTDPYQRAEGRYRLMPGIIEALADSRHAVLDPHQGHAAAPRPAAAGRGRRGSRSAWASRSPCSTRTLHATLEPGHPDPAARLDLVRGDRARPACRAR